MENNIIKSQIQFECAQALLATKNLCGTFELATGVGKTFAALQTIWTVIKDEPQGGDKYSLLILAEVQNRELTIMQDLAKFEAIKGNNYITDSCDVTFMCYQSAYKLQDTHWDFVIADEIHDSLTQEYCKFYFNNTYNMLIGLSATIMKGSIVKEDDEDKITKGMLLDQIAPIVYTLNQSKAIELGLIAPYKVLVLEQSIDKIDRYVKGGTKKNPFFTTEDKAYDYYDQLLKQAYFMDDDNPEKKKFAILNASRRRANVLWQKKSKISAIKQLLAGVNRKSVLFGNHLDSLIECTPYTVSSKNSKIKNEKIIEDFNTGRINNIASFKMLKQGANLTGASVCILHSYYSISKDYIQRLGRVLRVEEGKQAYIVILVTSGTQETKWFEKMVTDSSLEVVNTRNVKDIINYLKEAT